ncbi:condensation domain-containing protein [Mycobacterium sp.]|uniref:condensation domain-containing protein n=1 Tax=Mycobacterium sp. TaxID=1785 RepID=UPI0026038CFC|nr:condensation domain-containing protein [Mycobacterium sp.]
MVTFGTVHNWDPGTGSVISWHATPAAHHKARLAPINDVPASYQQVQHLRRFNEQATRGLDMARLNVGAWDMSGICDVPTMTEAINAHLRRHDTYHSWFECRASSRIVRHTFSDPADIEFSPLVRGEMTPTELRAHILATPSPLRWDCFTFGVVQHADHFTFYMSADDLVIDGMSVGVIFLEIHSMYSALVGGGVPVQLPEPASYHDYCVRQHQHTAALTLQSPPVRAWIRFAENSGGTLPSFPLPLGDPAVPCGSGVAVVPLMDEDQAERFETVCTEAGARFSGGLFACAAFAEYELTGSETYYGITPYDTRSTPAEFVTPGWFASFIPVTVPVAGASFGDAVAAAQASFDSGIDLADVPFERVVELATFGGPIRKSAGNLHMLSYADVRGIPLSSEWDGLNAGIYGDGRSSDDVRMWVNRFEGRTTLTVAFPQNPVARDSVERYIRALKTTCLRVAAHGAAVVPNRRRRAAALNASAARSTANRADGAGRLVQSVGLNL